MPEVLLYPVCSVWLYTVRCVNLRYTEAWKLHASCVLQNLGKLHLDKIYLLCFLFSDGYVPLNQPDGEA